MKSRPEKELLDQPEEEVVDQEELANREEVVEFIKLHFESVRQIRPMGMSMMELISIQMSLKEHFTKLDREIGKLDQRKEGQTPKN